MSDKTKIALIDDNENILTSLTITLEHEGFEVSTFTNGSYALEDFKEEIPNLIILDIKMPDMDGFEVLRNLRQFSNVPVIFLTSKDEEIDELLALKMGADDFIKKPFSQNLLLERIKSVLRRAEYNNVDEQDEDKRVITRGNLFLDPVKHLCTWKGHVVNLTVTEFQILEALVEREGIVKTRDSLLDVVGNDQDFIDDRAIDSHIRRLRKKFKKVDDKFNNIETLYGVGYRFDTTE